MQKQKIIKDPAYGYIDIGHLDVERIINTSSFQRLRDIIQTSYSALFPSALHNRFCHSLGVFHLGCIAYDSFLKNVEVSCEKEFKKQDKAFWERAERSFLLACLLHDIAHTPFSHVNEDFYDKFSRIELAKELEGMVEGNSEDHSSDGKPHERLSVVLGLKLLNSEELNTPDFDKELFARCIIGKTFQDETKFENGVKNCLIELLNSKTIDVDKLDYLVRDSLMSGYQSMNIDFKRLLSAVTMVSRTVAKMNPETKKEYDEDIFCFAFNKNAVSVLESVIIAHDSQRKWIQTHPAVLYDSHLLKSVFRSVNEKVEGSLVCLEVFEEEGITCAIDKKSLKIKLFSDADILFLAKNYVDCSISDQYFNRSLRRKPLWKSEAEYKLLFEKKGMNIETTLKKIQAIIERISETAADYNLPICGELIEKMKADLSKGIENPTNDKCTKELAPKAMKHRQVDVDFLEMLETYSNSDNKKEKFEFDFVFIHAKQFLSGYTKNEFKDIEINFPARFNDNWKLGNILDILNSENKEKKMFYIFTGKENYEKIDIIDFIKQIKDWANKNNF